MSHPRKGCCNNNFAAAHNNNPYHNKDNNYAAAPGKGSCITLNQADKNFHNVACLAQHTHFVVHKKRRLKKPLPKKRFLQKKNHSLSTPNKSRGAQDMGYFAKINALTLRNFKKMSLLQKQTPALQDERLMAYALRLAAKHLGATAPNPVVGCVIALDGEIISTGVTAKGGRPHAEKIAIDKITDKKILKNATLYVTLEPCSHFGQTAPCVDEIIKNSFKKVVIAAQDSDSRVNGEGIKKLREASIDVVLGVLEKEAREINRGFFCTKEKGRPFVTLKLATSLDGKIATQNFDSKWITSKKARDFAHHLRAVNDAILVGANTVRRDDPSLDCRIPGLEDFSPKRIVLTQKNDLNLSAKIFQNQEKSETIILSGEKIDLLEALKNLAQRGINSLLVEGGQKTATEFLKENLVDELVWIQNKKIIGSDGISAIGDLGFTSIDQALTGFTQVNVRSLEEDIITTYRKL